MEFAAPKIPEDPPGSLFRALIASTFAEKRYFGILETQPLARAIKEVIIGSRNKIPTPMAIPGIAERPTTENRNPIRVNVKIMNKVRQN